MRITKNKLKQVIKEEYEQILQHRKSAEKDPTALTNKLMLVINEYPRLNVWRSSILALGDLQRRIILVDLFFALARFLELSPESVRLAAVDAHERAHALEAIEAADDDDDLEPTEDEVHPTPVEYPQGQRLGVRPETSAAVWIGEQLEEN